MATTKPKKTKAQVTKAAAVRKTQKASVKATQKVAKKAVKVMPAASKKPAPFTPPPPKKPKKRKAQAGALDTLDTSRAGKPLSEAGRKRLEQISPEHQQAAFDTLTHVPAEFTQPNYIAPTKDTTECAVFVNRHRNTCIRIAIGRKNVTYIPLDVAGLHVKRDSIEKFNEEWRLTLADYDPAGAAQQYLHSYGAAYYISEEARTLLEGIASKGANFKSTVKETDMTATTTATDKKKYDPKTAAASYKDAVGKPAAKKAAAPSKPAAKKPAAKPAAKKAPAKAAAKPAAKKAPAKPAAKKAAPATKNSIASDGNLAKLAALLKKNKDAGVADVCAALNVCKKSARKLLAGYKG